VSIDRISFKPPPHLDYGRKGFIHWDADTSKLPWSFGVQGVLYLTDTAENQGGFQCIPNIHNQLTNFGINHPSDYQYVRPDLKQFTPQSIPGNVGDLLIWHRVLATAAATTLLTVRDWRNTSACGLLSQLMRNIVSNESDCGKTGKPLPLVPSPATHAAGKKNVRQPG
jgi:hypothetical protein